MSGCCPFFSRPSSCHRGFEGASKECLQHSQALTPAWAGGESGWADGMRDPTSLGSQLHDGFPTLPHCSRPTHSIIPQPQKPWDPPWSSLELAQLGRAPSLSRETGTRTWTHVHILEGWEAGAGWP